MIHKFLCLREYFITVLYLLLLFDCINSYIGRRLKKRQFRALWIQTINAGVRQYLIIAFNPFASLLFNVIS